MRKHIFGKQLQRDTNERKALFKSLMSALIEKESIKTTEAKAKAVRSYAEKMITKAKKNVQETERMLQGSFTQPILKKFVSDIAPRFSNRPGGYTRIVKIGNRLRDNAKMVVLEWVEKPVKIEVVSSKGGKAEKDSKGASSFRESEATAKIKKESHKGTSSEGASKKSEEEKPKNDSKKKDVKKKK